MALAKEKSAIELIEITLFLCSAIASLEPYNRSTGNWQFANCTTCNLQLVVPLPRLPKTTD